MNNLKLQPLYLILGIAFFIRLGWVLYTPALPTSDFETYNQVAIQIAEGTTLITSYRVPGYSLLLAAIYKIFGVSLLASKLVNVLLSIFTCLFTYYLACTTFNKTVALIATAIVGLLPSHILYTGLLASENLFTPLFLASATFFLCSIQGHKNKWLMALLAGFMLGLSALVRPIALFLPGTWFLSLLWRKYDFKQAILIIFLVGSTMVITFTPWLVYTYQLSGRFVIQSNGGVNWLMGAHPQASGHYHTGILAEFYQETEQLSLDGFEEDSLAYNQAFAYIRTHPPRWVGLIPLKWFHLFKQDISGVIWNFKVTYRPHSQIIWYLLLLVTQGYYMILLSLSMIGFFLIHHISGRDYDFLLSLLFHWLLFHAVTIGVDRFHLPLLPILAIFAGLAILAVWAKYIENKKKKKPISIGLNSMFKLIGKALLWWGFLLISFGGYFLLMGVLNLNIPSQEDLETLAGLVVITLIIAIALPVGYSLRRDLEIAKYFERF